MAELDVGKLSLTIEADGRAAISELNRVKEAAEDASADAARAYLNAGDDMADAFEPAAEAAEETAEAVKKMGDEAEKTGDAVQSAGTKATRSLNDMLESAERFGSTMTATVSTPLIALYTAMVKGASDLTETIGKTEVVFGDLSGDVMTWSEGAVESMGLAQATALDMASTFGDMAVGMGLGQSAAADMSTQLTQLAADLAGFKNISTERAAQALTGVYTGETEALKSLGVVMTQANLQAFAYSQGITTQVSAMSQAEQVQLRYQYVMAQTASAQGDFVRTGGNLANQSRALVQTLKQAGNAFGNLLIPQVTEAVSWLREGVQSLAELDDRTKTAILSIGAVTASIGPLVLAGTKVVKLVTALKTAMAAASLGPVAIGVAAITAGVIGLYNAIDKANNKIDTASDRYKRFENILSGGAAAKITADTEELDALDGRNIQITYSVEQSPESDQEAWDAFHQKIVDLGWETKEYTAIGTFVVDEATLSNAEAYKTALFEAATATDNYEAAVNNLNSLLDQSLAEQVTKIHAQAAEQAAYQTRLLNSGVIDRETYDANIQAIVDGATDATEALENEYEITKRLNEQFNNGLRVDDASVLGEQFLALSGGETLNTEDYESAIATLEAARAAGEDMSKYQNEAMIANSQLAKQAIEDYEALQTAQEEYSAAMEAANKQLSDAQSGSEQVEILQRMIEAYVQVANAAPNAEEALARVKGTLAEQAADMGFDVSEIASMQQELEALLTTSEGLMSANEAYTEYGDGSLAAAYQEQMEQAIADAETARAQAAETFASTLNDLTGDFTAAETQMIMEMISQTGVAISEADAEMIAATESMIDQMATAAESGGAEVLDKVSEMIANVGDESANAQSEGKEVGAAITAGITQGLNNGTGTLYTTVRSIVNKAITEAKLTAKIESPSRVMRDEVGAMLVQGISVGVERETPNTVKTIRQSVEHMVSGAAQVISRGSITVPAISMPGTAIDYARMGEAMTDAVSALRIGIDMNGKEVARNMREDTARQQALRAHEINIGKGRIG